MDGEPEVEYNRNKDIVTRSGMVLIGSFNVESKLDRRTVFIIGMTANDFKREVKENGDLYQFMNRCSGGR